MLINKIIQTAGLGLLLVLTSASASIGQIIYGQPTAGNIHFEYSSWTAENDTISVDISQLAIPLSGFVPLRDNLELRFSIADASSKLEAGTDEYTLSGLNNLRLQINQSLADDRLLLSAGLNLPTGKKELSLDEEYYVLQALSENYLEFPIRNLGEGLGINLMAGGAAMAGQWRLGLALAYQINGKYDPYEDYSDYNPGDQMSIIAGANLKKDRHDLSLQAVYTSYTDDKVTDEKVFDQADNFDCRLSHSLTGDKYITNVIVGMLFRGQNTVYDTTETVIRQLKLYGDEFYFHAGISFLQAEKWTFTPSLEIRAIGEDEANFGSSSLFGIGGLVGRALSEKAGANIGLIYFTGSADGGNIDISGLRFSAGLMGTF